MIISFLQDTTDEDSDFEEGYRRKQKPVKLKIKKEKKDGVAYSEEEDSTESDWEPEAEIVPAAREKSRSGRQRKRPSFFQEFESQENNLDSILAEFEQNQVLPSLEIITQYLKSQHSHVRPQNSGS